MKSKAFTRLRSGCEKQIFPSSSAQRSGRCARGSPPGRRGDLGDSLVSGGDGHAAKLLPAFRPREWLPIRLHRRRIYAARAFSRRSARRSARHGVTNSCVPSTHRDGRMPPSGCGVTSVVGKTVVEQRLGRFRTGRPRFAVQHDRDQLHAPALSGGRQTIPGGRGIAGLEAGRAVVEADKLVGVGQAKLAVRTVSIQMVVYSLISSCFSSSQDMSAMS